MPKKTDRELMRALGARIAALRRVRGLTQEQLAASTGVEPLTISRVERGARALSLGNVVQVAQALQVELSVLFDFERALDSVPPGTVSAEWMALWAQLTDERRELAIRLVRELVR